MHMHAIHWKHARLLWIKMLRRRSNGFPGSVTLWLSSATHWHSARHWYKALRWKSETLRGNRRALSSTSKSWNSQTGEFATAFLGVDHPPSFPGAYPRQLAVTMHFLMPTDRRGARVNQ